MEKGSIKMATNKQIIWDFLYDKLKNPYGTAALMGNLFVESKLKSVYLQSSYSKKLGLSSEEYTLNVDNGSYTNFVQDKAGYGLAQWTYWSRKEKLFNFAKSQNKSVGDLEMQLNYLWTELQGYKTVMNALLNAKSIREASDVVVKRYENPEHQEEEYLENRAEYGRQFYNQFYDGGGEVTVEKAKVVAKSGSTVRFRSDMDISSHILMQVPVGTIVDVNEKGSYWCKISVNGITGYMMSEFLDFSVDEPQDEFVKIKKVDLLDIYNALGEMLK